MPLRDWQYLFEGQADLVLPERQHRLEAIRHHRHVDVVLGELHARRYADSRSGIAECERAHREWAQTGSRSST